MKYRLIGLTTLLAAALSIAGCGGPGSEQEAVEIQTSEQELLFSKPGAVVLDWVEEAFDVVRNVPVGTPAAGRLYAMTFAAMHDAVNGINRQWGFGFEHALVSPSGAPAFGNRRAAAAAAAHAVLVGLQPSEKPALDAALADTLQSVFFGKAAGVAWGEHVGAEILQLRSNDGTQTADNVTPSPIDPTDPGVFRQTFDRRYANMTPFAIQTGSAYLLSVGPPALTSKRYAANVNEVKVKGSILDTDPTRQDIAEQWNTGSGTIRPTGSAIQAAVALARSEGTDRFIGPTARLFALIGMAVADTLIPIWDDKANLDFFFWRPKPAIQRADEDGNRRTIQDAHFETRFKSTGGSPEYPSGQSAFVSAVATVLEEFYNSNSLTWCFSSDGNPAGRCYTSAREMADEGGLSRIFQGVHYRFTVVRSRAVGNGVGLEVATHALQPVSWAP